MAFKIKKGHFKNRSYSFVYGSGCITALNDLLGEKKLESRAVIVSHPELKQLFSNKIEQSLGAKGARIDWVLIPQGEKSKTLETVEFLYAEFANLKVTKSTPIIALGGGVLQDVVNFTSATYLRGVPFIQVPTSLLSQADIGIGGCAGDHPKGKSLIGTFYQPGGAILDSSLLASLPLDEIKNGISEIINKTVCLGGLKPAKLAKDIDTLLSRDEKKLSEYVMRSNAVKLSIIEKDEMGLEGKRFALDFGHTLTYAIEKATDYTMPHGFALGIGMNAALMLSEEKAGLSQKVSEEVRMLIKKAGLPLNIPGELKIEELLALMHVDQKARDGSIRFALISKIGKPFLSEKITDEELTTLLSKLYK